MVTTHTKENIIILKNEPTDWKEKIEIQGVRNHLHRHPALFGDGVCAAFRKERIDSAGHTS